MMFSVLLLSCAFQAQAVKLYVSPVEKVVQMIRDLQQQVQDEGLTEAKTYDKFACFCKSKSAEKIKAIEEGEISVGAISARIGTLTADRDTLDETIQGHNDDIKQYQDDLDAAEALRKGEKKTFDDSLLDMNKAVSSLDGAIATLKSSGDHTAFLQVQNMVKEGLLMADALNLGQHANHKVVMALLQQPSDVPVSNLDFHSGEIIGTLEGLQGEFRTSRTDLENAEAGDKSEYLLAEQAKRDTLKQAQVSLANANKERSKTTEEIAQSNQDLTSTNALLNDDRVYLKDLTDKCQNKANAWDQRSAMRADELAALTQALAVLESTVAAKAQSTGAGGRMEATPDMSLNQEEVSFVQVRKMRLSKTAAKSPDDLIRDKLVSLLTTAGKHLKSTALVTLATKVESDPFVKIKGLIQELIERLLQEEADEADKKGWCDKEIAAATMDRQNRLRDVEELHTGIENGQARLATLTETKTELTAALLELNTDMNSTTANRNEEKAEHEMTIEEAKAGEAAVDQAIDIIGHFYGEAANKAQQSEEGASLLQGPADDVPDAGFGDIGDGGSYGGSQSASTGIMGMMDVIKSDFARSILETTKAEEQANRDFIAFNRETQMSLGTKTTGMEHTDAEIGEVNEKLTELNGNLRTEQALLDTAVQTWEQLMPGCVADPGMSYEERVQRRNDEVEALKAGYCILDNKEVGCAV